jgi:hypothetical protein
LRESFVNFFKKNEGKKEKRKRKLKDLLEDEEGEEMMMMMRMSLLTMYLLSLFYRNFLGETIVRRVTCQPGVEAVISTNVKDEIQLSGNSVEGVSQSAADIQQICRVRHKDIRKVRNLPSVAATVLCSKPLPKRSVVLQFSKLPAKP